MLSGTFTVHKIIYKPDCIIIIFDSTCFGGSACNEGPPYIAKISDNGSAKLAKTVDNNTYKYNYKTTKYDDIIENNNIITIVHETTFGTTTCSYNILSSITNYKKQYDTTKAITACEKLYDDYSNMSFESKTCNGEEIIQTLPGIFAGHGLLYSDIKDDNMYKKLIDICKTTCGMAKNNKLGYKGKYQKLYNYKYFAKKVCQPTNSIN